MAKYILVFWRLWYIKFFLLYFTGHFIKQSRCMPFGLIFLCQIVSFSFNRFNMQNFWTWYIFQIFKCIYKFGNIMSVNRAKIPQLKRFKQITALAYHTF